MVGTFVFLQFRIYTFCNKFKLFPVIGADLLRTFHSALQSRPEPSKALKSPPEPPEPPEFSKVRRNPPEPFRSP